MTFDDWMKARNPKYHPTDDTVALRELRDCWSAAQKVSAGDTAKKCDHDYKCTYEGMDGERYRCTKCGDSYYLDYEEMK